LPGEEFLPIHAYNTLIGIRKIIPHFQSVLELYRDNFERDVWSPVPYKEWKQRESYLELTKSFHIEVEGFVDRVLYPTLTAELTDLVAAKERAETAHYGGLFNRLVDVTAYLGDIMTGITRLSNELTDRRKSIDLVEEAIKEKDERKFSVFCEGYTSNTKECSRTMNLIVDDMTILLGRVRDSGDLTARLVLDELALLREERIRREERERRREEESGLSELFY